MKIKILIKLALILAFGALFGLFMQHNHEKWHNLGKSAYLNQQSEWFDKKMANLTSAMGQMAEFALVACIVGGAYEGGALLITTLVAPKAGPKNS